MQPGAMIDTCFYSAYAGPTEHHNQIFVDVTEASLQMETAAAELERLKLQWIALCRF